MSIRLPLELKTDQQVILSHTRTNIPALALLVLLNLAGRMVFILLLYSIVSYTSDMKTFGMIWKCVLFVAKDWTSLNLWRSWLKNFMGFMCLLCCVWRRKNALLIQIAGVEIVRMYEWMDLGTRIWHPPAADFVEADFTSSPTWQSRETGVRIIASKPYFHVVRYILL